MIYFTDSILIPGNTPASDDLKKALAHTAMPCHAQTAAPDFVIDLSRWGADEGYTAAINRAVARGLESRKDVYTDWSGGRDERDPEVAHLAVEGQIDVRLENFDRYGYQAVSIEDVADDLENMIKDSGILQEGVTVKAEVSVVDDDERGALFNLELVKDPTWVPERY